MSEHEKHRVTKLFEKNDFQSPSENLFNTIILTFKKLIFFVI